ncbi:MAG: putative glycoside hydrolase [Bacillota bacterium]
MKKVPVLIIAFLLLSLFLTLALAEKAIFSKPHSPKEQILSPAVTATTTQKPADSTDLPSKTPLAVPSRLVGAYSTSWVAGSKRMEQIIQFIKDSGINAVVIDLKDDTGTISYPSAVPLAKEIGAGSKRIANLKELVSRLRQEKIYAIARIVVFKDPLLARKHPEIAVLDKNGGLWRDRKGMIWVDPHNRQVWKYNLDIAKEAVNMGFSEVQFDYVRFLSDGKISNCVYPFSKGELKEDVISNFLSYAKKDLNTLGAPLSADIFGLALSVPDDLNIGQKLEKIANSVDYISPMIYPSHYPKGSFGFSDPDGHPYEVVAKALQDGNKRLKNCSAKLRPWIQDFSLGHSYGRQQMAEQIKALEDNGIHDFLLWNPSNRYELSKYPSLR